MARHIYIGGYDLAHDRIADYERGTLEIDPALTYQIDTAKFRLRHDAPAYGDEVIIEDDTLAVPRIFAGRVVMPNLDHAAGVPGPTPIPVWEVDCDDYTFELDAAYVVEDYQGWTADAIFINLTQKYAPNFTYTGVQSGAPSIPEIEFNYVKLSDAFKTLCDYVGWQWQTDYYRDLSFFDPLAMNAPAPQSLGSTGQGRLFRNLKHKIDIQNLRNRVYVKGGTMASDLISPAYQIPPGLIDGMTATWTLPYQPSSLTATVNGSAATVGVENQDTEADFDYMYSTSQSRFRCSSQTAAPAVGTTILLTFTYPIPIISVVDDLDSQAALQAVGLGKIENGVCTGVFEYAINDSSLTTPEAAEARGQTDLRQYSNPLVTGQFDTDVPGWYPGQLVTLNVPSRGISGTYMVQKCKTTWPYPTVQTTTVYYGGRLKSILDTLQTLVSAQQTAASTPSVLRKITYIPEITVVGDEEQMYLTERVPPYHVGDPDAICGFVVVG